MRLSNSKVKCYRRCPKRFEYKYVRKLRKKQRALTLFRGDWLHQLLMVHYDGHDWRDRQAELTANFMKLFEEEREEYGDLPAETERIMTSYLMHWHKQDRGLHIVDSELDEIVKLPTGDEFNFVIDLVVEEPDGGLWLWDHKTVKNFMPEDFMLLDAQLARYFWAAERMGYKPIRGVLFNELITNPPTVPKLLEASGRLEKRKNIRCDVYTYYREIKRHGLDPRAYADMLNHLKARSDQWFRRTRLPRDRGLTRLTMQELAMTAHEIKSAERRGHFPRNPMKECTWDCDYLAPCMVELMGGSADEIIRLQYDIDPPREEK